MSNNDKSNNDKNDNIDIELLFFYLIGAIFSFGLYLLWHPIFLLIDPKIDFLSIFIAYLPDLILFLILFVPYCFYTIFLIIQKLLYNKNINNNIFVILFFPLISFISKGISLYRIYDLSFSIDMIRNNLIFIFSVFIGPIIILISNIVIKIQKRIIRFRYKIRRNKRHIN